MPTTPDLDRLELTVGGQAFDLWTSATLSDDFLQPCQTLQLAAGTDESRIGLIQALAPGQWCQALINNVPVFTGYIDSVGMDSGRKGTTVTVTARDLLSPAVDGNVDPKMSLAATTTISALVTAILKDQFGLELDILEDEDTIAAARNRGTGRQVGTLNTRKYKRRPKDPLKSVRPNANEGAYQYLARIIHREGLHLWCTTDGAIALGRPDYEQEASYELLRLFDVGESNNIETTRVKRDNTGVPSHVWVAGQSSKPGDKFSPKGHVRYEGQSLFKPFYAIDQHSDTIDHANTVARFILAKAVLKAFSYDVTVRGFSHANGAVYQTNTVATVRDDLCGVSGPMWVHRRVFRKGRDGTFTDLTLVPVDSFTWALASDEPPPPPPENYPAARKKKRTGVDEKAWRVGNPWYPIVVNTEPESRLR